MAAKFSPTGRMLEARGLYRRWLAKHFSTVTLAGLAPDDEPILLRQIYVPLMLTPKRVSEYEPEESIHREGRPIEDWLVETEPTEAATGNLMRIAERLQQPEKKSKTFLISGEAGSGKTTLISSLVDSLAGTAGDQFNRRFEGFVPFPILLREAPIDQIDSLWSLVNWWLKAVQKEERQLVLEDLTRFLNAGQAVLLLDGLDEVGTLERRSKVLGWLKDRWIQSTTIANIAIVTARPSGFEGITYDSLPPAWSLHVAPFSRDQIRQYLERWFELRPMLQQKRQDTVGALLRRLTSPEQAQRLLPLARRPAYLASLAFVHGTRGELPYTRASLYELLIEAYIEMLDRQRGLLQQFEEAGSPAWDRQEKLEILSAVAFQAHIGATDSRGQADRRFLWPRAELEEAVRNAILYGGERLRTICPEHAALLTAYFLSRTGLLVETREGHYQFGHLSFQEYLTALFLLNLASASTGKITVLRRELLARLGQPGWLEVALLALAIDATRSGGKGHPPVLGALDLADSSHFALLSAVLAGEELRLTPEERQAWLLVWATYGGTRSEHALRVAGLPANREGIEAIWRATCEALAERRSLRAAFQALAKKLHQANSPSGALGQLLGSPPDSVGEIPFAKLAQASFPAESAVETAAAILRLPLFSSAYPEDAARPLLPVVQAVDLFSPGEPGPIPSPIWFALDALALVSREIEAALAERTPLLRWLADDFFSMRAAGSGHNEGQKLLDWRTRLWLQALRIERLWWCDLLIRSAESFDSLDTNSSRALDRALDRARALALDRARALDRSLARDWELARDRALVLTRDRDLDRTWALALARGRDRVLARALDRDRALALALDRALDRPRDRALALGRDRALARALERARARDRGEKIFKRKDEERRFYFLSTSFLNVEALGYIHPNLTSSSQREEVVAELSFLRKPIAVASGLSGPLCFQAEQEWEEVLQSPLSPVPLLEDLLSRDWRDLSLDEESVLKIFERGLDSLSA